MIIEAIHQATDLPPDPLEINIQMNKLPMWAKNFIEIGTVFAQKTKLDTDNHPSTLALCIPKIDFATSFIALGVIINSSDNYTTSYNLDKLKQMLGTWVSFQGKHRREIGWLSFVPEDETGMIVITMYKKKLPDFSKMSSKDAHSYTPPKCKSCEELLIAKRWHSIQSVIESNSLEIENGVNTRAYRTGLNQDRTKRVKSIFNANQAQWITQTSNIETTLICNRARLTEEISQPILFNDSTEKIKLESILRPASTPSFKGSEHSLIIPNSRLKNTELHGICLVEGGPNLCDALRATRAKNRIILIERCAPSYSNCARTLREAYAEREADFNFRYSPLSKSIITLGFKHHGIS